MLFRSQSNDYKIYDLFGLEFELECEKIVYLMSCKNSTRTDIVQSKRHISANWEKEKMRNTVLLISHFLIRRILNSQADSTKVDLVSTVLGLILDVLGELLQLCYT